MNPVTTIVALAFGMYVNKTYRLVENYRYWSFVLAHLDGPGWLLTEVRRVRLHVHPYCVACYALGQMALAELDAAEEILG